MEKVILVMLIFISSQYITSQNKENYYIKSVNINDEKSNFGTSFYGDDFLVYATSVEIKMKSDIKKRRLKRKLKRKKVVDGLYHLNFSFGFIDELGNVLNNKQLSKQVNSNLDEIDLVFTKDLKTVYFTRNTSKKSKKKHLELFRANVITAGFWSNITKLPFNSPKFSVGHPSLSDDGKVLYFASDMQGSYGKLDIFKVAILSNNLYGTPINLGSKVNTSGDETTPYVSNNTLYFSSDGRGGLGDLDVFSIKLNSGSKAKNIGAPVNSSANDLAFIRKNNNDFGYFTSDRNTGKGSYDIYFYKTTSNENPTTEEKNIIKSTEEEPKDENKITDIVSLYRDKKKVNTNLNNNTITGVEKEKLDQRKKELGVVTNTNSNTEIPETNTNKDTIVVENTIVNTEITYTKENKTETVVDNSINKNTTTVINSEKVAQPEVVVNNAKTDIKVSENTIVKNTDVVESSVVSSSNEVVRNNTVVNNKSNSELPKVIETSTAIPSNSVNPEDTINSYNRTANIYADNSLSAVEKEDLINNYNRTENIQANSGLSTNEYDICQEQFDKINNVFFDLNKDYIRSDAANELDKVIRIMKRCPNIIVVASSHTDCRAPENYNLDLSQRRADSTVEYILRNGDFLPNRISAIGYGESRLRNGCFEGVRCSESQHQFNRRTQFEIVNF